MAIEAFLKGWVSRMLPQAGQDNDPGIVRLTRFGDVSISGAIRKQHALVDEGSYFVANNGQSGSAQVAVSVFTAASPFVIVANMDSPANPNAKRIHLDYMNLGATAAGGAASTLVALAAGLVIDTGTRYSTGGTEISNLIVSPNMDAPTRASIAKVYVGNLTATTATAAARTIVGQRILRPAVSATVACVVGDQFNINFGGVEQPGATSITVASPQALTQGFPPVSIGPGQAALLYLWLLGATTPSAASFVPELGWWER